MRAILLIARRDLGALFQGVLGFSIIAVVLFGLGVYFQFLALGDTAAKSSVVLSFFFQSAFGATCFAGLLLSMGSISTEIRDETLVTLYTAPISEWQIILGKWLGTYAFVLLFIALTFYMPLLVAINGSVNPGHLVSGYLGVAMVGAAVTAVGTFTSSITRYQLLALVLNAILVGSLIIMWWVASKTDPPFSDAFGYLAMYQKHFIDMSEGTLHSRDAVYYASLTFLALLGARVTLGARRWR